MSRLSSILFALGLSLAATSSNARCEDWAGFRGGPEHTGTFHESRLPRSLPAGGPRVLWRADIGKGYSGPAVAHGRVFVADHLKEPTPVERVLAFDAVSGRPLWTNAEPCSLRIPAGYENGPRATPTVEENKLLMLGAMGHLTCLDARQGTRLWSHDVRAEFHATQPAWGFAASPLVHRGLVIATVSATNGASVMAFDLRTGRERWRSLNDVAGYASPVIIEVGRSRQKQLIVWTASAINALDPDSGRPLWRVPRKLAWDQATATPIWDPASGILLCASDREGCLALRPTDQPPGVTPLWDRPTLSLLHGSAVRVNDSIYAIHHNGSDTAHCGEFRKVSVLTGDPVWSVRGLTAMKVHTTAHVAFNSANQIFYITNEAGELILGESAADGWHELGRAQINARSWSPPAFADRRLYHRAETKLVCVTLD